MDDDEHFELDYPPGEEPIERANRRLDIATLTPEQFDIFMAGFESGRSSGWDDGYAACEEAYASRHRYALTVMRRAGDLGIAPDEILGE